MSRRQGRGKTRAPVVSLLDEYHSDGGRLRLDTETWSALGVAFHRPVLATAVTTSGQTWSFLCTSSLLLQGEQQLTGSLDPRVLLPPAGVAHVSPLRLHFPAQSTFEISIENLTSAPINAQTLLVSTSPGLSLEFLQVKLHQTLITPGCCILVDARQYIQVISAEPAPAQHTAYPLYRITAGTQLIESDPSAVKAGAEQNKESRELSAFSTGEPEATGAQPTPVTEGKGAGASPDALTPQPRVGSKSRTKAASGISSSSRTGEGRAGQGASSSTETAKKKKKKKSERKEEDTEEEDGASAGGANSRFGLLSALLDDDC